MMLETNTDNKVCSLDLCSLKKKIMFVFCLRSRQARSSISSVVRLGGQQKAIVMFSV